MDTSNLSKFIAKRIEMIPTKFTLQGSPIGSAEIASERGMLPLIALYIAQLHTQVTGESNASFDFIEPADPATHMLSSSIISLPKMPEGLLNLIANQAVLYLAREPLPEISLPMDLSEATLLPTSDLEAHIAKFSELVISPAARNNLSPDNGPSL